MSWNVTCLYAKKIVCMHTMKIWRSLICATFVFLCLTTLQKDNDGTLFQKPRLTAEDVDILQNGPLNDPELMNDLRPNFWCQVRTANTMQNFQERNE